MKYILLHGMGQNASSWDKTISYLSDKAETIPLELSEFFGEGNCTYSKIWGVIGYMVFLPQFVFMPYNWWVYIKTGQGK